MSKRIELDFHPVSTVVVPALAGAAASGADWVIAHPTEVTGALARYGPWGIGAAVLLAGALPSIARVCRKAAGDAPQSPEAAAINTTLQASDAGPDVPAFQPGVRVPIVAPPNTDRASAATATAALPMADQGI